MNPPMCAWCHEPVADAAVNATSERVYHGACYIKYAATQWPVPALSGIAAMSHDERVEEGLELP